jgi:hypothetical protein
MNKSFLRYAFIAFMFSTLIGIPISWGVVPVFAQEPPDTPDNNQGSTPEPRQHSGPFGQPPFGQASNFTFGPIGSIQNNESGQPAWVVVGFWRSNLLSFNETTTTTENSEGNASSGPAATAIFNADLRMIMLNGSGAHTHVITNFMLSNISSNENGTTTITGNSTISMREAPIIDVPTTIKVSGEIISIFPDPSKVNLHFGNTPIYGVVIPEEALRRPPIAQSSFP